MNLNTQLNFNNLLRRAIGTVAFPGANSKTFNNIRHDILSSKSYTLPTAQTITQVAGVMLAICGIAICDDPREVCGP